MQSFTQCIKLCAAAKGKNEKARQHGNPHRAGQNSCGKRLLQGAPKKGYTKKHAAAGKTVVPVAGVLACQDKSKHNTGHGRCWASPGVNFYFIKNYCVFIAHFKHPSDVPRFARKIQEHRTKTPLTAAVHARGLRRVRLFKPDLQGI